MPIRFFSEEIEFKILNPNKVKAWLIQSANRERKEITEISYIFCSDPYLLKLNQEYLNHDTLTDIITFDYSQGNKLSGEIYISIDRVMENSQKFDSGFVDELHRVIIHGVLHLCGYKDKNQPDKTLMRKKEDAYLSLQKKRST